MTEGEKMVWASAFSTILIKLLKSEGDEQKRKEAKTIAADWAAVCVMNFRSIEDNDLHDRTKELFNGMKS